MWFEFSNGGLINLDRVTGIGPHPSDPGVVVFYNEALPVARASAEDGQRLRNALSARNKLLPQLKLPDGSR